MNKTNKTTTEEKIKLQPFPLVENEEYLLKLKNGNYVIAYWGNGQLFSEYNDDYIAEEIESFAALKDLGL